MRLTRRARQALSEAEVEVEKTIEYYRRDKQDDRIRAAG